MATIALFTPEMAHYPGSNFPAHIRINNRPVLAFDAATDETCYFTFKAPQDLTLPITVYVQYKMASATTGSVYFQAAFEAISDGDAVDLDATTSFDTANSGNGTVPGTAGNIDEIAITMTNNDSIAAGDYARLSLNRDADNGSDTATGDSYILTIEVRDSA